MSWPSTDFELKIQMELDSLREFKKKFQKFQGCSRESRKAIITAFRQDAKNWLASDELETKEDGQTLLNLCDVLDDLDKL